mmetsp:Transcript_24381/g.64131  ORF Transcript_24381/g.64131 Transcript_24381/m.64131 type:complete len:87 (-) Transcript_24381:252-512(-)
MMETGASAGQRETLLPRLAISLSLAFSEDGGEGSQICKYMSHGARRGVQRRGSSFSNVDCPVDTYLCLCTEVQPTKTRMAVSGFSS